MTRDRTRELLEAYGADPARWPREDDDREVGMGQADLAGRNELRREAARLDGLLDSYAVERASGALRASILAVPNEAVDIRDVVKRRPDSGMAGPRGFSGLLGGMFPKLAGLVLASVLGFMVGMTDMLPARDQGVSMDVSGLALGEDGLGGFDS